MNTAKKINKTFEDTNRERWNEENEKNISYFYPYAPPLAASVRKLIKILDKKYHGDEPYSLARTELFKIANELDSLTP